MGWDLLKKVAGALTREADLLDRPDLKRAVVEALIGLSHRGSRAAVVLPPGVRVRIAVGQGSVSAVRGFVDEPAFSDEVEAELKNRLPTLTGPPPLIRYEVEAGPHNRVVAEELEANATIWLRIEDGDRAGSVTPLSPRRVAFFLGRSPWSGGDRGTPNDVVLTDRDSFVSRRAAVLRRAGLRWEIEPLDQGEDLEVEGELGRVCPRNTLAGKAAVRPGDRIHFLGPGQVLTVTLLDRDPGAGEG